MVLHVQCDTHGSCQSYQHSFRSHRYRRQVQKRFQAYATMLATYGSLFFIILCCCPQCLHHLAGSISTNTVLIDRQVSGDGIVVPDQLTTASHLTHHITNSGQLRGYGLVFHRSALYFVCMRAFAATRRYQERKTTTH
jgi:hypothetical protein